MFPGTAFSPMFTTPTATSPPTKSLRLHRKTTQHTREQSSPTQSSTPPRVSIAPLTHTHTHGNNHWLHTFLALAAQPQPTVFCFCTCSSNFCWLWCFWLWHCQSLTHTGSSIVSSCRVVWCVHTRVRTRNGCHWVPRPLSTGRAFGPWGPG